MPMPLNSTRLHAVIALTAFATACNRAPANFGRPGATTIPAASVSRPVAPASTSTVPSTCHGDTLFRGTDGGITPAVLIHWEVPERTAHNANSDRHSAAPIFEVIVDTDGSVCAASLMEPSERAYDAAAAASVRKWKFRAARRDGKAVPLVMYLVAWPKPEATQSQ
jgi:hypothetical protein